MIDAAIVGLGRWGKTLVAAVQGKSDGLRFTRAVSRNPDKLRDDAARYRLDLVSELGDLLRQLVGLGEEAGHEVGVAAAPKALHAR